MNPNPFVPPPRTIAPPPVRWTGWLATTLAWAIAWAGLSSAPAAKAAVITFSDQVNDYGDVDPNPYSFDAAQGFPATVTATFFNFLSYDFDRDHTQQPTGSPDNKLLTGVESPDNAPCTLTFSKPVEVPSLWVTTGPAGSPKGSPRAIVTGSLGGVAQFTFTLNGSNDVFYEVTGGAHKAVDLITFSNFQDDELDDVTVNPSPVPEPGGSGLFLTGLVVIWRGVRPGVTSYRPRPSPARR